MAAAIPSTGRRTIANLLRTARDLALGHPSSSHRASSRCRWSTWTLARALTRIILGRFTPDEIDAERRGETAYGQHIKRVPGRKADVKDCQWIAQLLQPGLLRASFVPPPIRELRDLIRQRAQLVGESAAAGVAGVAPATPAPGDRGCSRNPSRPVEIVEDSRHLRAVHGPGGGPST